MVILLNISPYKRLIDGELMVPYHKKHVFSGLYIYQLVLPEPANSQDGENK